MDNNKFQIPVKFTGIKRILRAFIFSRDGFKYMLREDAFRQEILLTIIASISLFFLNISLTMKTFMLASLLFVLVVETLNTGIERIVDMATKEFHSLAKEAKDMGSLAVLISFIIAGIIWSLGIYEFVKLK